MLYLKMLRYSLSETLPKEQSRLGDVVQIGPACFELDSRRDRFIFLSHRKWNPLFAVTESAWILSGRNDLDPPRRFIASFGDFSDDGSTLNGAYGYRLRSNFGIDQIEQCIAELTTQPLSRRVVLTMYSPNDLNRPSKDVPCNTSIFLKRRGDVLDMTVLNRSNDLYLGVPYNMFVFHVLQKYVSDRISCSVGTQRHFTDCLHLYTKDIASVREICRANSEHSVRNMEAWLAPFRVDSINESRDAIASGDFSAVQDVDLNQVFVAHESYRRNRDVQEFVEKLPRNVLGYTVAVWATGVCPPPHVNQKEFERMTGIDVDVGLSFEYWDQRSEGSLSEAIYALSPLVESRLHLVDEYFSKRSRVFGPRFGALPSQTGAVLLILCLALTYSDPMSANSPAGRAFRDALLRIAQKENLSAADVRSLYDADEIVQILRKSSTV